MPIVEIALLLEVGDIIGGWNTVAVVIITAFVGASLVKQQGLQTFMSAQQKMQTGQIPSQEVAEGLLLLVAGVLLVTPGFVTDGIGLLFSMPFTRPVIARYVAKHILSSVKVHSQFSPGGQYQQDAEQRFRDAYQQSRSQHYQSYHAQSGDAAEGEIIDGEYTDHTTDPNQQSLPQQSNRDKKSEP